MTELEMDRHAAILLMRACRAVAIRNRNDGAQEFFDNAISWIESDDAPWLMARRFFWDGTRDFQRVDLETAINSAQERAADESPEGRHADVLIERLAVIALPNLDNE